MREFNHQFFFFFFQLPKTQQEWMQVAAKFREIWNFPNALGAMDGKHVVLQSPVHSGAEFHNYKSSFSIVLFALVDAEYNFLFVDVGCQGRISDGGVFKDTELFQKIEDGTLNIPHSHELPGRQKLVSFVILADSAFLLTEHIMKPYAGNHPKGSLQRTFNYRLSRGRRVVENAFGIISQVFRVLRKPMLVQPEVAEKVVMAIAHLHNFLRTEGTSRNLYTPPQSFDREENGIFLPGSWRQDTEVSTSLLPMRNVARRSALSAKDIRDEYANYFINEGEVPWQNDHA